MHSFKTVVPFRIGTSTLHHGVYTMGMLLCKGGGLHPILDLHCLIHTYRFKMLSLKLIMSQMQSEDWFVTIDFKNAYFHIEILPEHRKFLKFAFGAKHDNQY